MCYNIFTQIRFCYFDNIIKTIHFFQGCTFSLSTGHSGEKTIKQINRFKLVLLKPLYLYPPQKKKN